MNISDRSLTLFFSFSGNLSEIENALTVSGSFLSIIGTLIFNIMVMLTFAKMRKSQRKKTSNVLLLNQSFADICLVGPTFMHGLIYSGIQSERVVITFRILFMYSGCISIGSILLTTLDRFAALRYPFFHRTNTTQCKVLMAISFVWLGCIVPPIGESLLRSYNAYKIFVIVMFIIFLACILIILLLLLSSFATFRSSRSMRLRHMTTGSPRRKSEMISAECCKEKRMVKILFAMALSYATTIIPYMIVTLLDVFFEELNVRISQNIICTSYLLYTLSACIDPILTIFIKDDFKQAKNWMLIPKYLWRARDVELQLASIPLQLTTHSDSRSVRSSICL